MSAGLSVLLFVGAVCPPCAAQNARRAGVKATGPPEADAGASELRPLVELYSTDRGSLLRTYPVANSPTRQARLRQFYTEWLDTLARLDFEALGAEGRIDYLLFKNHLEHELHQADIQAQQFAEIAPYVPFAKTIFELEETRRRMQPINPAQLAALLTDMKRQIEDARRAAGGDARPQRDAAGGAEGGGGTGGDAAGGDGKAGRAAAPKVKKNVALRAAAAITGLRATLRNWFDFYNGYDPVFTWWAGEPHKGVDQALQSYASFMSEKVAGVRTTEGAGAPAGAGGAGGGAGGGGTGGGQGGQAQGALRGTSASARPGDASDIVGDPIGRDALLVELNAEMIPYTPEELIAIANKEMDWCEAEMKKAARALGYGDDWHKALEHVKDQYVEPGKQPQLIRDLAAEAIEFVDKHDLVTVPPLARETWRMQMMTPDRQLVNPFFTGGEVISVSYPTNTMSHEQKLMSLRGNNIHFARATVFHELIPGHHLQGYMTARYKPYRAVFRTPFWGEGWALYWELLLWDMNFARSPENRIGMLFWRMHRCARIIFSLSFHLGRMTPQQAIALLVKRVGHEPENAIAEVRRSFDGSYTPLYQAAYLLGGLQLYALHKELVDSGRMTNRAFHDAILRENAIPIELVRASLTRQKLPRDYKPNWKFYWPLPTDH